MARICKVELWQRNKQIITDRDDFCKCSVWSIYDFGWLRVNCLFYWWYEFFWYTKIQECSFHMLPHNIKMLFLYFHVFMNSYQIRAFIFIHQTIAQEKVMLSCAVWQYHLHFPRKINLFYRQPKCVGRTDRQFLSDFNDLLIFGTKFTFLF